MNSKVNNTGLQFSMDKDLLDIDMIFQFLQNESYWAKDRPRSAVERSIENSLCFGVYSEGRQIGFARAVTDNATVYYLADFFLQPEFQDQGIGGQLMDYILEQGELSGLRGILTTQTAHSFYQRCGFSRDNDIVQRRIMVRP